ncbi:Negative elongation factor B isoform 2 [Schistosoma japonicum]|nr:Negative elongation factor B isoform 2 [Schistosoma japonicum]
MPNQPSVASATLCTLRFDLLMSLNEAKIDRLCVPDRIHRFVWCLDACVRNRRIDQRHASELAYHLQLQRRRWAKETADEEQESYEKSESGNEETSKRGTSNYRGKNFKSGKTNRKRSPSNTERNYDSDDIVKISDLNLLERDMHMACRDPWVVYTVCTSLIRYVLNGLYEDKLPREIPEVHLLVHLLVLGLGDDLVPYSCLQSKTKETYGSKRSTSSSSTTTLVDDPILNSPSKALISYILPAVAQLQVLTWRAQVAEEILTSSNSLWSTNLESTGSNSGSTSNSAIQRSTSHESRESVNSPPPSPPLVWQKRIKDATQCINITVPSGYLAHPIGYLILQYHCLFCLERNELATLRALLKLAVQLAQSRTSRTSHNTKSSTQSTTSQPTTPTKTYCYDSLTCNEFGLSVVFRWRPEVLQALVLGISRLPQSAPAFVDINRNTHVTEGSAESSLGDNTVQSGSDNNSSSTSSFVHTPSMMSNVMSGNELGNFTNTLNHSTSQNISSEPHSALISGSIVTRANLAGLLRSSLPLVNDVQLLALAQVALLVPGPTSSSIGTGGGGMSSGGGGGGASTHPSLSSSSATNTDSANDSISSPIILSERERLVNTLARHCSISPAGNVATSSSTNDSNLLFESSSQQSSSSGSYKSSDPRVLAALDVLRKDIERCYNSLASPLTPTNLVGIKTGSGGYSSSVNSSTNLLTNFTSFQMPDAWITPSPRSPVSSNKYPRLGVDSSIQSSSNSGSSNISLTGASLSCYSSSSTSSYGLHLPIGTPLTNPGLMGATPHLSNLHIGHGQVPSMRKMPVLTPPPTVSSSSLSEFRIPLSPNPIQQRNKFGSDTLYASCPSPAVHRPGTSNDNNNNSIITPRSHSPPS